MADDTPAPAPAQIKHEMRTKTIPEDGTYRIDKIEDGRLLITVNGDEYDADPSNVSNVIGVGNFVRVKFDGKVARITDLV